ncbi:MAG TPA: plastocyanin/azurin family copper-binding protein [Gemmatimonadales bacterium]|nr:plastocyanin/azurin family copper-binding protein [Gemmatimonadales bacterium]
MRLRLAGLAAGLMVLVACGSSTSPGGGGGGGGGHSTTITVENDFFSPTPDTVPAGQVTFTWSTPSNGHNVTWDTGPGTLPTNSATMASGTYSPTLQAGTYTYHCSIHVAQGMRGTIVVQ